MANPRKILRYLSHYGMRSTLGLIHEKLVVDKKRFSAVKKRHLPDLGGALPVCARGVEDYLSASRTGEGLTVLYLIHYFYPLKKGGTERFTLNIAKEAAAHGHTPIVLVLEANEPKSAYPERSGDILWREYAYDGVRCIGFRHLRAPLGLYYKNVRTDDAQMRAFMHTICEREGVDLVHATYPQPFASFLAECKETGVPYIVTCTDFAMMCHYSTMVDRRADFCGGAEGGRRCAEVCPTYGCRDFAERHARAADVLAGASAVTVPSAFVARMLGAEFPGIPFLPVNHGIGESFAYRPRGGGVRQFVYAGTISPLKGIHLLIEAFMRLPARDISLHIYGEGDENYAGRLRAMADERVVFHGAAAADEMPAIYGAADCVVVPSMWYETYNFVVREAAATGALVLAAAIGAMPEAIREGENGFLFAPSDADSLYDALVRALSFDRADYVPVTYRTTAEEGSIYDGMYRLCAAQSKKA